MKMKMKTQRMAVYPASDYKVPVYRPFTKLVGRAARWLWSWM